MPSFRRHSEICFKGSDHLGSHLPCNRKIAPQCRNFRLKRSCRPRQRFTSSQGIRDRRLAFSGSRQQVVALLLDVLQRFFSC